MNHTTRQIPANDVWSVAVAIDRFNNGYVKNPVYDDNYNVVQQPNKELLKQYFFFDNNVEETIAVTEEDRKNAEIIRNHFKGYLFKQMAGGLNSFQQSALKAAQIETFTYQNRIDLSVVSSLMKIYRNDLKNKDLDVAKANSTHIEKDKFHGDAVVERCNYSQYYGKFRITAMVDNKLVDFWYKEKLNEGMSYKIKGRVKTRRDDNTTQLNFVKVLDKTVNNI